MNERVTIILILAILLAMIIVPWISTADTDHRYSSDLSAERTDTVYPVISSVSPHFILPSGNTYLFTIAGKNFEPDASTVTISGNLIASYFSRTAEQIQFWYSVSSVELGAKTVMVTNPGTGLTATDFFTVIGKPRISSVSPSFGFLGRTSTITIKGTNFETNYSEVTISGDNVTIGSYMTRNATHIIVPITIESSAEPGVRTITLTNPDTSKSVTIPFTIHGIPQIISFFPPFGLQGNTYPVIITGTNFEPDTATVMVSGNGVTVGSYTIRNSTHIIVPFTITSSAEIGERTVIVTIPGYGDMKPSTFIVGPNPVISSFSPHAVLQGKSCMITITGMNFEPDNTTVAVSGDGISVGPYITRNATHIIVPFTIALSAETGKRTVTVTNRGFGGTTNSTFTVGSDPVITSLSPSFGLRGKTYPVTITGTNFEPDNTTIAVSGEGIMVGSYTTRNITHIIVPFTIASSAKTGERTVTVTNQLTGSVASGIFMVKSIPVITNISPSTGQRGKTYTVTIIGTDFEERKSTVTISGTGVTVKKYTTRKASKIICTVMISSQATAGKRTVTVKNPTSGTKVRGTFTIVLPPTISGITPKKAYNSWTVPVTIKGTNFRKSATVKLVKNKITRSGMVQKITSTTITCTLPLTGASPGNYTLVITNTDGTIGSKINAFTIQAAGKRPVITAITPNTGVSTASTRVTINGNNFRFGAIVQMIKGTTTKKAVVKTLTSKKITCILPTQGATVGSWNVTIINTDQTNVTKNAAFTVKKKTLSGGSESDVVSSGNNVNQGLVSSLITFVPGTLSGGSRVPMV